jgi:hypothetical protein
VIVDYLNVFGTRICPPEHDPPLIIDADRVLTRQIALKSFKAVAGRRVQGLKKSGGVQHNQFSASYFGKICRETLRDHAALEDRLGKLTLEVPDHERNVSHWDTYCKAFVSQRDTTREHRASPSASYCSSSPKLKEKPNIDLDHPPGHRGVYGITWRPRIDRSENQNAIENAGIEFIAENGGGPGVRLRKRQRPKQSKIVT